MKAIPIDESEARENGLGICIECEERAYGVEPDAREYPCESCDELAVYGMEEAILMGFVYFRSAPRDVAPFKTVEIGDRREDDEDYQRGCGHHDPR